MKNTIIHDALILCAITLVAGCLLGLVNEITKDPIAAANAKTKQEACAAVFESASTFEEDATATAAIATFSSANYSEIEINEVLVAKDASGATLGYVITVTSPKGYGGDVELVLGYTNAGVLNGISFLTLNETAGMGMKAKDAAFKDQFNNKTVTELVLKTASQGGASADNEIDCISGCTITSTAVTRAVNAGMEFAISLGGNK